MLNILNAKRIYSFLGLLLLSTPSLANDLKFSGFISAAGGTTLEKNTTYRVEPTNNGTYDDHFRFDPESVAGLQVQAVINEDLRGTLQIVGKGYDGFETHLEWAYITYDITPELSLNAGRYRLPIFYYSEFLDVGYAYHWIRPPIEVYSTFTSALEGANLIYNTFVGDFEITTQLWYGTIDETTEEGFYFDTLNNTGINLTVTYDWLKVRAVYNTLDLDSTFPTEDPDNPFRIKSEINYSAIALMADYNQFIWRSEATHSETADDIETDSWYISAGYRIGKFLPHLTHAEEDTEVITISKTKTNTVGVAWYFRPSAVAKLEYLDSETQFTSYKTETELVAIALDIIF